VRILISKRCGRGIMPFKVTVALQELNPIPFCAAILNTSGWVAYSVLEGNLFIFFGGELPCP